MLILNENLPRCWNWFTGATQNRMRETSCGFDSHPRHYLKMFKSLDKIKKINPLKEIKETKREFTEKTITLILGGFGLVAALAWNEAIKSLFETLFEKSNELIGKFIYAIIVTAIVVFVSIRLKKISEKKE